MSKKAKVPKVLLLGYNFASVMNSLAEGFIQLGVPFKALSFELYPSYVSKYEHIRRVFKQTNQNPVIKNWLRLNGIFRLLRYLLWCDVIHVFYDTAITNSRKELFVFKFINKKKFINFLGSDVRNPTITSKLVPYFAEAFKDPGYEYKQESETASNKIQQDYQDAGFLPIVWETDIYINPAIFPKYYIVPHAAINKHNFIHSQERKKRVLIIHSPTAPVAKGTKYVVQAIEELKNRGVTNFDFQLLTNISNDKYQQYVSNADILVDQFIWGAYGMASAQALAVGKVVVCYLLPQRVEKYYGKDCPIVNATIHTLQNVLTDLIENESLRKEIGKRSKQYYQQMHAPLEVAKKMVRVYNGNEEVTDGIKA